MATTNDSNIILSSTYADLFLIQFISYFTDQANNIFIIFINFDLHYFQSVLIYLIALFTLIHGSQSYVDSDICLFWPVD